jgi:hypothetical protein
MPAKSGYRFTMESGLSMAARAEIVSKYARDYRRASKKERGRLLDEVVAVTGWSRDNTALTQLPDDLSAGPRNEHPAEDRGRKQGDVGVE